MRPINTHSSPAVISDSTEKQNLNQTMSCTADGEQKSEAVKGEHSTEKQNLNQTMSCTADGEQKSEAVKGERE